MKKALLALAATAAVALPMAASAQLTANVSLTSNYKFRGQDQDSARTSSLKPAVQGGFDYAFGETGFYIGNWNSSVNWLPGNSLESDVYGGYKMTAGDFALDFGSLAYLYSGHESAKTVELYASAGWGPLVAKYSGTVSKGYFDYADASGNRLKGRGTGYFNLAYAQEVMPSLTAKASLGYTRLSSDVREDPSTPWANYTDYSVGASYDFGAGVSLSGSLVGANKKNVYGAINKNRLIVALTKTM